MCGLRPFFSASFENVFTDWGGGGDIAAAALHAVALAYRRMGPQTALAERMLEATGCDDIVDVLERVMRGQVRIGGGFAPQVFESAAQGDVAAQSIVRRAGATIGANVLSVAGELDMLEKPFDLVAAGGVFSSRNPLLYKSLSDLVHTRAHQVNVVHWQSPPVVGALLLALDLLELSGLPRTDRLSDCVSEALAV